MNTKTNINKDHILNINDYSEISIIGDGNCFFRCLSLYFEAHQENHLFYRDIIYKYIVKNKKILKDFFIREDNETNENYEQRYNIFINNINKESTYAGDFEISTAALAFKIGIYVYYKDLLGYKFLQYYNCQNEENEENIYIIYKNNNHFNLLVKKDINLHVNLEDKSKFEVIHKNIEKNLHKPKPKDINSLKNTKFFDTKYVNYPRDNLNNFYNEVYEYLKFNKIPDRLKSEFQIYLEDNNLNEDNYFKAVKENPFISQNTKNIENRKKEKRQNFRNNLYDKIIDNFF